MRPFVRCCCVESTPTSTPMPMPMLAESSHGARLVSREQRIAAFDPIEVFASAIKAESKVLWLSPNGAEAMVGLGAVWRITADGSARFKQVATAWRNLVRDADLSGATPRLIGGFSFDPTTPSSSVWSG